MNYFKNCTTLDEAKNLFRKLCLKLHPDHGGKAKDFIKMRAEFKSLRFDKEQSFDFDKFESLIYAFNGLENIEINFVGSFIWLKDIEYGAMYRQKETIKSINLDGYNKARWASKKKLWYFSPVDYKKKSGKNTNFEQIKQFYGCKSFASKGNLKLSY